MKHDILQQYRISAEPYYHPQAQEIQYYQAAYQAKLPMMLKGPTGCGCVVCDKYSKC